MFPDSHELTNLGHSDEISPVVFFVSKCSYYLQNQNSFLWAYTDTCYDLLLRCARNVHVINDIVATRLPDRIPFAWFGMV